MTLVSSESMSVCMEEHVDVEHLRSNTDGKADEELYVVVQEESCQWSWEKEETDIYANELNVVWMIPLEIPRNIKRRTQGDLKKYIDSTSRAFLVT